MNVFDLQCLIEDNYLIDDDYKKWFADMLSKTEIHIYPSDMPRDNIIEGYDYTKIDTTTFRGQMFDYSGIVKDVVVLHEYKETEESMCWKLLHELGHVYSRVIKRNLGYDLIIALSGGALNNLTQEEYNQYVENDDIHEARYEEQFVNNIANTIIGKNYDRHWWRKQHDSIDK